MKNINYSELNELQKKALDEAESVMANSYAPYTHFQVGAALFTEDGLVISGTNVENAAYGSSICAERAAIFRAFAMGTKKFKGIAIIARGKDFDTKEITGPCGGCRQVIYEASQLSGCDMEVVLSTTRKDKIALTHIKELLPFAFGPLDMGVDISGY